MTHVTVDLFGPIHKGLRALLFGAATAVARADFASDEQTRALLGELRRLNEFLREHALHEDMHVLPLVAAHDGDLARALARTHAQMEAVQVELSVLLARIENTDRQERPVAAASLGGLVNRLVAGHLLHMDVEESQGNALLWARATHEALTDVRARIGASMTPERTREWMAVLLPALNPGERAAFAQGAPVGTDLDNHQTIARS
jgi:hypothetical protein